MIWLMTFFVAIAAPKEDNVALFVRLVQDGHYSRAESIADAIEKEDIGDNAARYHAANGLLALKTGKPESAIVSFKLAVKAVEEGREGPPVNRLHLYIAQAYLDLDRPEKALTHLEKSDQGILVTHLLKAKSLISLQRDSDLWSALNEAGSRFPESFDLALMHIRLILRLGHWKDAEKRAVDWLKKPNTPEQMLQIAQSFREYGNLTGASNVLSWARAQSMNTDIWKNAAALSLEQEHYIEAADILSVLSQQDPAFALEGAEAFRRSGQLQRAMEMNRLVPAGEKKTKQRFAILIDQGRYERAIALRPRLKSLDLIEDDAIKYGLAYAQFQVWLYKTAAKDLQGISDSKLFASAVSLRQAIEAALEKNSNQ